MFKNPWFTLVVGLMVGLVMGYVFAERQPIGSAKAVMPGVPQSASQNPGLPDGHPPVDERAAADPEAQRLAQQVAEIQVLLAQSPDDVGLMVALANTYFDAGKWSDARLWYERGLTADRTADPNVLTDLAVVYRNLKQPERSLELLDQATTLSADHWQAWYNKVVVMHFDLHDHDGARRALERLQSIAASNPQVPDLTPITREVMGS